MLPGSLYAGLKFVKVQGEDIPTIGGIPKETGTFRFTITAHCYGTMVFRQTGIWNISLLLKKNNLNSG